MLDQEITEFLIKTANNVAMAESRYSKAKYELELQKAGHILENDWEKLLGKKKPTVLEKEAFILRDTEEEQREVMDLKVQRDYCRRIFEISMLQNSV